MSEVIKLNAVFFSSVYDIQVETGIIHDFAFKKYD